MAWTLDDIPWDAFEPGNIKPEHLALAKTACLVERNGTDYGRVLREIFHDDEEFKAVSYDWAAEEVQHGVALARWVTLADPSFDFEQSFGIFTQGHPQPEHVEGSARGSRCGELIARCVVETATSTYYTAIKETTDEPVLKAICTRIAADEYRHYQMFYRYLQKYQQRDRIRLPKRLAIAIGRIAEVGDKELSYALFSSHIKNNPGSYDQEVFANKYLAHVSKMYDRRHIERMSAMVLKAVGIKPHGWFSRLVNIISWNMWQRRARALAPQAA